MMKSKEPPDIIYRNLVNMCIEYEATIKVLRARVAELEEFIRFGLAEGEYDEKSDSGGIPDCRN